MDSVVTNELNKIADAVESNVSSVNKTAKAIEPGERVVCLNPVQGIYKGRCYIVDQYLEPGVITINEIDGSPVGAFRAGRFCLDNNEY